MLIYVGLSPPILRSRIIIFIVEIGCNILFDAPSFDVLALRWV